MSNSSSIPVFKKAKELAIKSSGFSFLIDLKELINKSSISFSVIKLPSISSSNNADKSTTFAGVSTVCFLKIADKSNASSSASSGNSNVLSTNSKSDLSASKSVFTEGVLNSETMLSIKKFKSSSFSIV